MGSAVRHVVPSAACCGDDPGVWGCRRSAADWQTVASRDNAGARITLSRFQRRTPFCGGGTGCELGGDC